MVRIRVETSPVHNSVVTIASDWYLRGDSCKKKKKKIQILLIAMVPAKRESDQSNSCFQNRK